MPTWLHHPLHASVSRTSSRTLLADERLKNPRTQYLLVSPVSKIPRKITDGLPGSRCSMNRASTLDRSRAGPMVLCHQPKPGQIPNGPRDSMPRSTLCTDDGRTHSVPWFNLLGGHRQTILVTSSSLGHSVVQCLVRSTSRIRSASNTTRAKGQFWLHGIKRTDRPRASNQNRRL